MSASALSKIENGDRRVDVDDLTVFAYILQTTPAALLTPPEDAPPPTRRPRRSVQHRRDSDVGPRPGQVTPEDLARYWKDQYHLAVNSIHHYDNLVTNYTAGKGNPETRELYEARLASGRSRRDAARVRLLALDPDALPAPHDDAADGWT